LTPERWQRIQQVFDAVVDLSEEARSSALRQACGNDSLLCHQVESLVWSSRDSDGFIEAAIADAAQTTAQDSDHPSSEQNIGPYRIEKEIGHGGMGAVFLAVRSDDEYRKQVAIKLVRSGMQTPELLTRFRAERQILANLDHPHIARLYDGGTTRQGDPYVVMEYVEGEALDQYCDSRKLSVANRLELFLKVCDAVRYAHQNLVVHRDIKPSNILVTPDGSPKLLDFGIAKLLRPDSTAQTVALTREDVRLMTPEYASPEQVRGLPITTASDVYALGVLLYELLTGHRPYTIKSYTPLEIEHAICEQEPEKPSTIVNRPAAPAEASSTEPGAVVPPDELSRRRATTTDKLKRELSGDLDNIVLMALRKSPERRYSSVEQLSQDIRRHLQGLPVSARKDTLAYRTSKFLGRHTLAAIVSVGVVALIAALTGFYTLRLTRARDRAQSEAAKSAQVAKFLTQLFQASDPNEAKGATITAKELLDRGAARVNTELASQPAVQAEMADVMGMAYLDMDLYDSAAPLLTKSLVLRRRQYGDDSEDVARSLNDLGSLAMGRTDFKKAGELFRQALAIERKISDGKNALTANILNNLGEDERFYQKYNEAAQLFLEALAINRSLYGKESPEIAANLADLEGVRIYQGRFKDAEKLAIETLDMRRRLLGNDHPEVAYSLHNLGVIYYEEGDLDKTESLFRQSLEMRRKILGVDDPLTLRNECDLDLVLIKLGKLDEAETSLLRVLKVYRRTLPPGHQNLTYPLLYLGRLYITKDEPNRAEPYLFEALKIREKAMAPDNWRVGEIQEYLGECFLEQRRFPQAEKMLTSTYKTYSAQFPSSDIRPKGALKQLIKLYEEWHKPELAARYQIALGTH
jgi:eukaryotic-like serine/threonine-protein kinase